MARTWNCTWLQTLHGLKPKVFRIVVPILDLMKSVKNVFHRLATEWIGYKFTPDGYIADGDKVAAYGTYTGINKITNKSFEARVVHLWKLKAGKIVSFEQFVDSQPVNDSMK